MTNPLEELCSNQQLKKQRLRDVDKRTCLDLKQVLNFVESKTKKNQSQAMKTAFSMAKDNKMHPIWITEEQALKLNEEIKYNVFIIESFKTELFDKLLKNKNCSIYGPSTIYYCKKQFNLPRRQFPIFNLCMRNLEICFDKHFERDELVKFFGLISLMCGKFSVKFKPTTTHLISNSHTTDKAILARTYGIPIMQAQWIRECWETSLSNELDADSKAMIAKFRLPVFHGFHVTTTQVASNVKENIKRLVQQNGGEFKGEFNPKKVTHLVISEPAGKKYETAKSKNINIMKEDWIFESVKHGYPLIEYDYLLEKLQSPPKKFDFEPYVHLLNPQSTSHSTKPSSQIISQSNSEIKTQTRTQLNSEIQTQIRTQPNSQINTQYKTQPETQSTTQQSNLVTINRQQSQIITPAQTQDATIVQPTAEQQSSQPLTQPDSNKPQAQNPAKTYCVKSKAELERGKNAFAVLTSSQNRQTKASTNLEDELDKLVTRLDNCKSSIFDGCDFCFYDEFNQNVRNLLKKCITLQNGTISSTLRKSVNHVIVNEDRSDIERKQLNQELDKFDHNVHQVSLKWIIQCSKSNKLLPRMSVSVSKAAHLNQQDRSFSQQLPTNRRTRPNRNSSIHSQPVGQSLRCAEETTHDFLDDYFIKDHSQQENQDVSVALKSQQQNSSQSNSYFNSQSTVTAPSETSSCNFDNSIGSQGLNTPQSLTLAMQNKLDNLMTVLNTDEPAAKSKTTITTAAATITTKAATKTVSSTVTSSETRTESKKGESRSQIVTSTTATTSKDVLDTSVNTSANTTITNLDQLQIDILNENQQYAKKDELILPIAWNDQRQKQNGDMSFSLPSNLEAFNQTPTESVYDKSRPRSDDTCMRSKLIEKRPAESFQIFQDESVELQPEKKNKVRKFNFIGYTPEEKGKFGRELAKLKIVLNTNNDLDYEYLITHETKLIKNECFFVSIAMGKWICHPDFYRRTLELGEIPNPLEYEWGSNDKYLNRLDSKYVQLAKACRYWRQKVKDTGKYAFNDQYLAIVSPNAFHYSSIITNGGGRVFSIPLKDDTKETYQAVLTDLYKKLKNGTYSKFTYVLIDFKKKEMEKLDLVNLVKPIDELNYLCLTVNYLSLFLVSGNGLKVNNCRINQQQSPSLKRSLNNSDEDKQQSKMVKR